MADQRIKNVTRRKVLRGLIGAGLGLGTAGLWAEGARARILLLSPLKPIRPAPDFALPNLDDKVLRLSDFRGKVVIVNFWATWCPPCRFEIPSMQRAWNIIKGDDIAMLAIHVGGNMDRVMQFAADYDVEFPVLLDADSEVIGRWPVLGLPTTIIVDAQGRMVLRAIGGRKWDDPEILAQIRKLEKP